MITDSLQSGDIVELKWLQPSTYETTTTRTVRVILTVPKLDPMLIGTIRSKIVRWECQVIFDSHNRRSAIPYKKPYDVNWLKQCEKQNNLKIISEARLYDKSNK